MKFNYKELEEAKRTLDIFHNVGVWMERFYKQPPKNVEENELEIEDKWLRSRTQTVVAQVSQSFENYEPFGGLVALKYFIIEDVSRFYLKRLKQRINEGKNVDAGMSVLYESLLTSVQLLSPYAPFSAEHLYLNVFKKYAGEESVSLLPWPAVQSQHKNQLLEQQMEYVREIINASANARMKANLKLRWPAEEMKISSESTEVANAVEAAREFIAAMTNIHKINVGAPTIKYEVELHSAKIGAKFKADSVKVNAILKKMKPAEIIKAMEQKPWVLEGGFEMDSELVSVVETASGYSIGTFDDGKVYVNTVIDSSLYAQGILREISRRIQFMRKQMGLVNEDKVEIWLEGDKEMLKIVSEDEKKVLSFVNAVALHVHKSTAGADLENEWEIEEAKIRISLKKV